MEQQHEIFKTETSELELLINSVTEIADDNVRKRWPSTLQSLSEVLNSELKRAKVDATFSRQAHLALGHYFGGPRHLHPQ